MGDRHAHRAAGDCVPSSPQENTLCRLCVWRSHEGAARESFWHRCTNINPALSDGKAASASAAAAAASTLTLRVSVAMVTEGERE